jgi:hypothetical protein
MATEFEELQSLIKEKEELLALSKKISTAYEFDLELENNINNLTIITKELLKDYKNSLHESKKYYNEFIKKFIAQSLSNNSKNYYAKNLKKTSLYTCEEFINDIELEQLELEEMACIMQKNSSSLIDLLSNYQSKKILENDFDQILNEDYELLEELLKLEGEDLLLKAMKINEKNLENLGVIIKGEPMHEEMKYALIMPDGKKQIYTINNEKAADNAYKLLYDECLKILKKGVKNDYLKVIIKQFSQELSMIQQYSLLINEAMKFLNLNSEIFNKELLKEPKHAKIVLFAKK